MASRIQRRRTKGWRMPEGAVYVGRPSRWGNPFKVGEGEVSAVGVMQGHAVGQFDPADPRHFELSFGRGLTAAEAVALYRIDLLGNLDCGDPYYDDMRDALAALAGKDLVCWCPLDAPCHADVLLEIANGGSDA